MCGPAYDGLASLARTVGASSAGCAKLLERNEFVFVAAAVAGAVCGREADACRRVVAADDCIRWTDSVSHGVRVALFLSVGG